jgi:non-lysosomal glucosylceramidase
MARNLTGQWDWFGMSGAPVHDFLPSAQICMWQKTAGGKTFATPLGEYGERALGDERLSAWNWEAAKKTAYGATFRGLYPYMEWEYATTPEAPAGIVLRQYSPFIPGDLAASSLPTSLHEIELFNPTQKPIDVSVMMSMPNMAGWAIGPGDRFIRTTRQQYQRKVDRRNYFGIVMGSNKSLDKRMAGQLAIVMERSEGMVVTFQTQFNSQGPAQSLWDSFSEGGTLPDTPDSSALPEGESSAAIAVRVWLQPGQRRTIPFAFTWDFPQDVRNGKKFFKYYTRQYGKSGRHAFALATEALEKRKEWASKIDAWQAPILTNAQLPAALKSMLINERYYLVDGGSWLTYDGRFASLEAWLFGLHSTTDVAFYTPQLIHNFPSLERQSLWEVVRRIGVEDLSIVPWKNAYPSHYGGHPSYDEALRQKKSFDPAISYPGPLKLKGAVVHHLDDFLFGPVPEGSPIDFSRRWQNHNGWKDLNSKLVLRVWEDYQLGGAQDRASLRIMWPAIQEAIEYERQWIREGLPYHEDFPDQTYDLLRMKGAATYTAVLWVTSLEAAIKIGEAIGDSSQQKEYHLWRDQARDAIQKKLWNGEYFRLDETSDYIMADALVGLLFAKQYGLPCDIPDSQVRRHLQTVYENNFKKFAGGELGIVNAMTREGELIKTSDSVQTDAVWLGAQRATIALMIFYGMKKEALEILEADYRSTWEGGFQYWTPEGITATHEFIAGLYMRAGAIDRVYDALQATSERSPENPLLESAG